jgi:hypothetical protein
MIGEILGKALISVKADTSQAKAAIKDLSATEQKAAKERVEAQEKVNNAWDASLKKHALVVAGVSAGIAIAIASVKKYQEHLKEMGDTGSEEYHRIQRAGEAVTKAQDNLQIALGRVFVAALPVVEAFAQMAQELANIAGGVGRVVQAATNIPGSGYVGKGLGYLKKINPMFMAQNGLNYGSNLLNEYYPEQYLADTNHMGGGIAGSEGSEGSYEQAQEVIHPDVARGLGWIHLGGGRWRPPTAEEKREREAKAKEHGRDAKRQAEIYADAWRSISGEIDVTGGKARGGYEDLGYDGFLAREAGGTFEGANFDQFGEYEDIRTERIAQSMKAGKELNDIQAQRESMLTKIFGPVSEFETYTTLWQGLETVVTAGLEAWISGSQSAGEAMKMALHGFAKNLAGEAVLQALRHTAHGIGMLAFPDPLSKISAAQHFKAAATWGAVAVAAGVVGKVTAPSQGGGGGGGGGSYAAAGIGGGGYAGGRERNMSMTVVMGDQFAGDSPRYVARKVRRNLNMARMYADYESEGN